MEDRIARLREYLTIPPKGEHRYRYVLVSPGERGEPHRYLEKTYREKGFWKGDGDDPLLHHRKESTICFAIYRDDILAGTISLFNDRGEGLPLDCLYGDSVESLRREGRKYVEIGALAAPERDAHILYSLFKLAHNFAFWSLGADDLLLTVHPRHSSFYRALFCMETAGIEKAHPSVNGSPAVLLKMDLRKAAAEMERVFPRNPSNRDFFRYYYRERPDDFPREIYGDSTEKWEG